MKRNTVLFFVLLSLPCIINTVCAIQFKTTDARDLSQYCLSSFANGIMLSFYFAMAANENLMVQKYGFKKVETGLLFKFANFCFLALYLPIYGICSVFFFVITYNALSTGIFATGFMTFTLLFTLTGIANARVFIKDNELFISSQQTVLRAENITNASYKEISFAVTMVELECNGKEKYKFSVSEVTATHIKSWLHQYSGTGN